MNLEFISEVVLPRLLAASVQSTLLVALVWALCRALPRLSAATRCWLWWLVALQLVVGLLWSSPLALPLLPAELATQTAPLIESASSHASVAVVETAVATPTLIEAADTRSWSWPLLFSGLWLLGLSVMITRTLRGYLQTRRLLRESSDCRDLVLIQAMNLAAEAHGLRSAPRLRLSSAIDSPQLLGPWRPVLLLPARRLSSLHADELDMALTHELIHLQRRDLWWGLLPAVAQHLFFFHPLVHLAVREYAFAREVACDAAVLAGSPHCAHDYGRLLVRLGVTPRPHAGLASASPTFNVLKRRLLMLHNTATLPRAAAALILSLTAVMGVMPYRVTYAQAVTAPVAPVAPTSRAKAPAPPPAPRAPSHASHAPSAAAPSAPPATPTPAAARSVKVPAAPPAPPAPAAVRGTFTFHSEQTASAFVLLSEDGSVADGSRSDLREAQALRKGNEALLWMRRGGKRYVARDPATLQRLRDSYAETMRLGKAQGELGERQGALGAEQGALGARQGELGMRMAELAVAAVQQGRTAAASRDDEMQALQAEQHDLGKQMGVLGERQAVLGRAQAALGEKQSAASIRAEREAAKVMDEAIAKGLAQALNN